MNGGRAARPVRGWRGRKLDEIYIERESEKLTPARAVPYDSEALLQQLIEKHPDLLPGQMAGAEPRRWRGSQPVVVRDSTGVGR